MRVLIDTNVAITFLTKREDPYIDESIKILEMCANREIQGSIALHSLSTIWYMARKLDGSKVRRWIRQLCVLLTVTGTDNLSLLEAIDNESFRDFEDAMQDCCACQFNADYIITANVKDFEGKSKIPAISPKDFLTLYYSNSNMQ